MHALFTHIYVSFLAILTVGEIIAVYQAYNVATTFESAGELSCSQLHYKISLLQLTYCDCGCNSDCYYKMVCMSGHFQMASVLKLVMMESHATPGKL